MTVKLKCPVCGDSGVLMLKTTITKTAKRLYRYEKWYVYHNRSKGTKQRWCYVSKKHLKLPEIKEAIQREQATQNSPVATQNIPATTQTTNNLKLSLKDKISPKRHFTHSQKCFQNEALSELNRFFQTTQQNHPAFWCFIEDVVAHFFS